ncbi:MAG: phosphotransferase enzyme family protein [Caulobacterales bacterium]
MRNRFNTHWRVRAGERRYVLRRFGTWLEPAAGPAWELDLVARLAALGLPVAAPVAPPRNVDGAVHILMPLLPGRALGAGRVDDARYQALGRHLADYHAAAERLPLPPQRPGWTSNVDGALPPAGGAARRAELLWALAKVDAQMARRFDEAARALEARDLPGVFADARRMVVHSDFAPWNLRLRHGRMTALLDFELAHVDVRAADVAFARRGYHDAVVDGYLERASLSAAELAALDALWLGGVLSTVWRVLEDRLAAGDVTNHGLDWNFEQIAKTTPYGAAN